MNCASNSASRIFWMLAMRESPKERMPLLSKALAILGEPQNPFVTAVTQIPLEPYNAFSLRALCASLSSSISIQGAGLSFSSHQTVSLDSALNNLI